jgi:Ca2+-binding RTX toxin-like protein
MTGSEGATDFVTDADLTVTGVAGTQIVDMVNWWLRNTAALGEPVKQIELISAPVFTLGFIETFPAIGTGVLSGETNVTLNGHSLGGHLATAFSRIFGGQWPVDHAYTYNSAGFTPTSGLLLDQISAILGNGVGTGVFPTAESGKQSNFFAENGINVTTQNLFNGQHGQRIPLFNEEGIGIPNHLMYKMTDALALGDLISSIDSSFGIAQMSVLFDASSNQAEESLEKILEGLLELFVGITINVPISDAGNDPSRVTFHEALSLLQSQLFINDQALNLELKPQYQTLQIVDISSLTSSATLDDTSGLAYRYALVNLNPFAVTGNANLYTQHNNNKQLDVFDKETGEGTLTERWLIDRAAFLQEIMHDNAKDIDYITGTESGHHYRDVETGISLDVSDRQRILFGDSGSDEFDGAAKDDHLYGGGGADTLNGNGGNDYLEGGKGDDTLNGNSGNDHLFGGAGDDTLIGGKGRFDILDGGAGNDTYIFNTGDQQITIRDADMKGKIIIKNGSEDSVLGTDSPIKQIASNVPVYSDDKGNRFVLTGTRLFITTTANEKIIVENFSSGSLGITLPTFVKPPINKTTILGDLAYKDFDPETDGIQTQTDALGNIIQIPDQVEAKEDQLFGSENTDRIQSGALNDIVTGKGGDDIIEGGSGTDILVGGAGDDRLFADNEADFSSAFNSDDIPAGTTRDWLAGGDGNDQLIGSTGTDVLSGGGGHDLLVGGAGNDYIFGDRDRVPQSFNWKVTQSGVDYTFSPVIGSTPSDPEGADAIFAGGGDDIVWAGGGNDNVFGGSGNDYLLGEDGDDNLFGDSGDDTLYGGQGEDILIGDIGNDLLFGGNDNDVLYGNDGKDELQGGAGEDKLFGGDGIDLLIGNKGNDTLLGGDGNDQLQGHEDKDTLKGGQGNDTLVGGSGNDTLVGGTEDDILFGDHSDDQDGVLNQLPGNDTLKGGQGNDKLYGDAGDDELTGGTGNDLLQGGQDNDRYYLTLGDGQDTIDDSEGNNKLIFSAVQAIPMAELINGLDGSSYLALQYSNDDIVYIKDGIHGAIQNYTINGKNYHYSELIEKAFSEAIDFQMTANSGALYASQYSDTLTGSHAADEIYGQGGDDLFAGGAGDDLLVGGEGQDTYVLGMGSGSDTVIETGTEINTIRLHEDLSITDLATEKRGQDLFLHLQGTHDGMILKNYYAESMEWKIQAADGTIRALSGLTLPEDSLVAANVAEVMDSYINRVKTFYGGALRVNGFQQQANGLYHKSLTSGNTYRTTENYQIGVEIDSQMIHGDITAGYYGSYPSYQTIEDKNFNKNRILTNTSTQSESQSTLNTQNSTFLNAGASKGRYIDLDSLIGNNDFLFSGDDILVPVYGNDSKVDLLTGLIKQDIIGYWAYPKDTLLQYDNSTETITHETYENNQHLLIRDMVNDGDSNNLQLWDHYFNRVDAGEGNDILNAETEYRLNTAKGSGLFDLTLKVPENNSIDLTDAPGSLLYGNNGDDKVRGSQRNDRLIGGKGNDHLYGGKGNDVYYQFQGDGHDIIFDEGSASDSNDVIVLPSGVLASDITISWSERLMAARSVESNWSGRVESLHSVLTLSWGTSDQIDIVLPHSEEGVAYGIEQLVFDNGSRLSLTELVALNHVGPIPSSNPHWSANNLSSEGVLFGGDGDDVLMQLSTPSVEGNDEGEGKSSRAANYISSPSTLFNAPRLIGGKGHDQLIGGEGNDQLFGGSIIMHNAASFYDTTSLFALGGLWDAGNTYQGGLGDDTLWTTAGNDAIAFKLNDGIDTVVDLLHHDLYLLYANHAHFQYGGLGSYALNNQLTEWQDPAALEDGHLEQLLSGHDTLRFGAGITADDIIISRASNLNENRSDDLLFSHKNGTDKVIFSNWYSSEINQLNRVEFIDGTVWEGDFLKNRIEDRANSTNLVSPISDQTVFEDSYYGLSLSLQQFFTSPETLTFGITIDGSPLSDWVTYNHSGGWFSTINPGNDQVGKHTVSVTATNASGLTVSDEFILTVVNTNDAPIVSNDLIDQTIDEDSLFSLTLPRNTFNDVDAGDNLSYQISLADNSAIPSWLSFDANTHTLSGRPGNDDTGSIDIKVTATDNSGLSANTDFTLTVNDLNPIVGDQEDNTLLGSEQADLIKGGEGNDILQGGAGNDSLKGGTGSDWLQGGSGEDTLVFSDDNRWSSSFIAYNAGSPGHSGTAERISITAMHRSYDLFDGGEGQDTLQGTEGNDAVFLHDTFSPLPNGTGPRIKNVERFDMGAGNDIVDLTSPLYSLGDVTLNGGLGNDVLWASSGNDSLNGGQGNDKLSGGAGNDTYLFARGDDQDTIKENDTTTNNHDVLNFLHDINHDQLWFTQDNDDLRIHVIGTQDQVTIANWYEGTASQVEEIQASDGHILANNQVDQLVQAMASFNPPVPGELSLSDDQQQQLAPVLAASWT